MFLKKYIYLMIPLLFLLSCVSTSVSFNKELLDKDNITIAVLPFKDYNSKEGNNSGNLARNVFETRLVNRGFKVISMESLASTLDLSQARGSEFTKEWIISAGEASGADYLIFGSVYDYRVFQYPTSFIYIFSWLETTYSMGITTRMVSAKTGEAVWTGSLTKKSYTYSDAAEEVVNDFIKSMKLKPKPKPPVTEQP